MRKIGHVVTRPGRTLGDPPVDIPVPAEFETVPGIPQNIDSHKKIREAEGGYNGLDNVRGMRHSSRMIIATWFSEGGIPRVLYPTPQLVYPQTILSSTSRSLPQRFSEIGPTYPCSTGPHSGAKRLRSRGHVGSR